MIKTVFDSVDVFILNDRANFAHAYDVTVEAFLGSSEGLTKREGRRAYANTLRFSVKSSVTVSGLSLRIFQGLSRTLEEHPVLMPFWPGVSSWASRASSKISGGLKLAYKYDWSQWELYTTVEPGWVLGSDFVVPVLYGFINRPEPSEILNPDSAIFSLDFIESSKFDYALTFSASSLTDGPDLVGYADPPKLFPFVPNFKAVKNSINIIIKKEQIGFGREKNSTFYSHEPFEGQSGDYILKDQSEVAKVLYWFQTEGSQGAPFWAATPLAVGYVGVPVLAGATSVTLQDVNAVQINDQLAATFSDGSFEFALIDNIVGNVLTLDAGFTKALQAGQMFRRLALAKLVTKQLKFSFRSTAMASVNLEWSEVRPEVFIPGDEEIGTTIGKLPARCYLYDFFWTLDGVTTHERHTSSERDMTLGGNTYYAHDIGHTEIRQGLFLDNDKVELSIGIDHSPILQKMARLSDEAPVFMKIIRAEISGSAAINDEVIFYGQITNPAPSGNKASPSCVPGGTKFDRGVPRLDVSRDCNNALFDEACALAKADWKFTAEVDDPGTPGYPFTFALKTLTNPLGNASVPDAGWFAGGFIVFGTGANIQRRAIMTNSNPVAGAFTVTLDRDDLNPYPAPNDTVYLYPGCDLQFSTCIAKFNNKNNFLGFPYLPMANPSAVKKNQSGAGGKK